MEPHRIVPRIQSLRDSTHADFEDLLRLNLESEAVLSPLSPERLRRLHDAAWYHRVACLDDSIAAFLIALQPRADWDSPNYLWFDRRYTDYAYVDRVVVGAVARHAGLATLLYEDLFRRTRQSGVRRITLEFDIDPPNEPSRRFHERLGFVEVGTQRIAGGRKTVSLRELRLAPAAPANAAVERPG